MKKYLLLFAFSALALSSCEDSDTQNYEIDMLKGEWKTVKSEIISGQDNKTVISTDTPTGCSAKNILEFRTDYYSAYTAFSGTGASCTSDKTEGTYLYNADEKLLTVKYNNDSDRPYKIIILSSSELKTLQLYDNIDYNGDQIIDHIYTTYKR